MKQARLRALLVARALSEDEPVGKLLRGIGALSAAEQAESGALSDCLSRLGLPADLRALAEAHPPALQQAQHHLSRLPSMLQYRLPLYQVLVYLVLIGLIQLLSVSRLPPFFEMVASSTGGLLDATTAMLWARVLLSVVIVVVPAVVVLADVRGRWGWARHLQRARHAALAAALVSSGAPPAAIRSLSPHLGGLEASGASGAELELVVSRSVARADQAHAAQLSAVRVLGIGLLLLSAGLIMAAVYGNLGLLGGPL